MKTYECGLLAGGQPQQEALGKSLAYHLALARVLAHTLLAWPAGMKWVCCPLPRCRPAASQPSCTLQPGLGLQRVVGPAAGSLALARGVTPCHWPENVSRLGPGPVLGPVLVPGPVPVPAISGPDD